MCFFLSFVVFVCVSVNVDMCLYVCDISIQFSNRNYNILTESEYLKYLSLTYKLPRF